MSQSPSTGNFDIAPLVEDVNLRCVAQYALVAFFLGFFLVPLETGAMIAIKTDESAVRSLPFTPPVGEGFTPGNIQFALEQLSGSFLNSSVMSILATIGSVLFGSMVAYGLTMVNWWVQIGMLMLFVIGAFVPYQAMLVPLVRFWNNTLPLARMIEPMVASISFFQGYHAKLAPLVITYIAYGIPICAVLSQLYYQSPPNLLVEAGKINSASIMKIYRRIILPISKPMFGAVFTYQFTQIYNKFLFTFTFVTGSDAPAVSVTLVLPAIRALTSGTNFGTRMSTVFLAVVPAFIPYVAFAEQFAKGLYMEA